MATKDEPQLPPEELNMARDDINLMREILDSLDSVLIAGEEDELTTLVNPDKKDLERIWDLKLLLADIHTVFHSFMTTLAKDAGERQKPKKQ